MSKWNIIAAFLLAAAMFAGPAAADGKTKRIYKPGPAPLNITCPAGYTKDKHNRCVRTIKPREITTCPQGYTRTTTGQCIRRVTQKQTTCPSGYTRNSQGQCIRLQRQVQPRRPVAPAPQQVSLNLNSFNGGVGGGVSGGYYGGGGFIPFGSTRSFSGVLDASASAFTFNRRVENKGHRPKPGCGGMGGCGPKPMPKPKPKPKPGCGGCGGKG